MAGEASPSITWGPLISATVMKYLESGALLDQVHKRSPLLKWIRSGKRIRTLTGGERIKVPLMFEGSGNYKRYSGDELLDVSGYDGVTNAFFDWKQAAVAAVISGLDKRSNMGESQVRNLTKDKIFQAEATFADELATDVYSDGTANGSLQVTGLAAMVATTTTSGTYASIDTAVNTAWRNNAVGSVGNAAVNLLPNLRTIFNDCGETAGVQGEPDGIFTTQTVAETLEALVQPAVRYTPGGEGELSIKPAFRGAPINWEAKCQSGTLYVLNSNHIFWFVHKDANLTQVDEGFQRPVNQDAHVEQILFQGNTGTNLRAGLGKLSGIT